MMATTLDDWPTHAADDWMIVDIPSEALTEVVWSDWSDSEATTKDRSDSEKDGSDEEYTYECSSDDDVTGDVYREDDALRQAILESAREAGQLWTPEETTEDLVARLAQDYDEHMSHALASVNSAKVNPTSEKTAEDEALARELAAQDEAAFRRQRDRDARGDVHDEAKRTQGSQANPNDTVRTRTTGEVTVSARYVGEEIDVDDVEIMMKRNHVRFLTECRFAPGDEDVAFITCAAASNGSVEALVCASDRWNLDMDARDIMGRAPLHVALTPAMVICLHNLGATIDLPTDDENAKTPLMTAVHRGNRAVVRTLLDLGADINYITPRGLSVLEVALWVPYTSEQYNIILDLLDRGVNVLQANAGPAHPVNRFLLTRFGPNTLRRHGSRSLTAATQRPSYSKIDSRADTVRTRLVGALASQGSQHSGSLTEL